MFPSWRCTAWSGPDGPHRENNRSGRKRGSTQTARFSSLERPDQGRDRLSVVLRERNELQADVSSAGRIVSAVPRLASPYDLCNTPRQERFEANSGARRYRTCGMNQDSGCGDISADRAYWGGRHQLNTEIDFVARGRWLGHYITSGLRRFPTSCLLRRSMEGGSSGQRPPGRGEQLGRGHSAIVSAERPRKSSNSRRYGQGQGSLPISYPTPNRRKRALRWPSAQEHEVAHLVPPEPSAAVHFL